MLAVFAGVTLTRRGLSVQNQKNHVVQLQRGVVTVHRKSQLGTCVCFYEDDR